MDFAPGSSRKSPGAFSCLARLQRSLPRSGIASRGEVGEEPTRQGPALLLLSRAGVQKAREQPGYAHAECDSQGELPRSQRVRGDLGPVGCHGEAHRVVQRRAGDERHDSGNHEQQRRDVTPAGERLGVKGGKRACHKGGEEHARYRKPDGQINCPAYDAAD